MAVHMNDCVPNIFLPCFCINYLIMLVTTATKITKPQWRNTVVFIAHMSGVSRELVGGSVSADSLAHWAGHPKAVHWSGPGSTGLAGQLESAPHVLHAPAGRLGHVPVEMIESQGKARLPES